MKKYSVLVKQVLMSAATAVVFAFGFTSCTDDAEIEGTPAMAESQAAGSNNQLQKPIGLVYTDFISSNDVQILNADTTQLSVSKAYADKIGVTDFVNHPMGIWQDFKQLAYLRRATAQRLDGDKYILDVVPSDISEIVQNGEVSINTGLYMNPAKATASTRSANSEEFGSQYVDESGVVHPMAVYIQAGETTRGGGSEYVAIAPEDVLYPNQTRGFDDFLYQFFDGIYNGIKGGDKNAGVNFTAGGQCDLLSFGPSFSKDIKVECGKESGDTITIGLKVATDFTLGCRVNLGVKNNKVSNFETIFVGTFGFNPKVTVGSSKKLEIPEEKSTFLLGTLPQMAFSIPVMGVPVPIVLNNHVDLKFNAGVEGKLYAGIQYQFESEFEAGAKYDGKWHPHFDGEVTKSKVSFITPRADIHAEAGVGLFLCSDALIGGVAGPSASIGPKLQGEADMSFAPFEEIPFKFDAAIKVGLGGEVGGKLSLAGYDLGKYTAPFNIGPEITLWEYSSWKKKDNDDSENSFYFNDMTKKANEEAAKEKAVKAATPKDYTVFEQFKREMQRDSEVRNLKMYLTPGSTDWAKSHLGMWEKTGEIYNQCLNETFRYALAEYGHITPARFEYMRAYLLECMVTMRME